jgi:hypothetical protein
MYRKRVSSYFPALAAALASACATQQPGPAVPPELAGEPVAADEAQALAARATVVNIEPRAETPDDTVCRKESVTGSHRPRVVCQTQAQRNATRAAAQDWYRSGGRNGEISQVPIVP